MSASSRNSPAKDLATHIHAVFQTEKELQQLTKTGDVIIMNGRCTAIDSELMNSMQRTLDGVKTLQKKLIENLRKEHVHKASLETGGKAQVVIDILIRNLFERTADVGFLATDDDIRKFLLRDQPSDEERAFLVRRLREYQAKYSVYGEIVVLDTQGNVACHLDENNPIRFSRHPLVAHTLQSGEPFVETFGPCDLQPALANSLIYSCKIREHDKSGARSLGVLCLCFRFENEMAGIFNDLRQSERDLFAILDSAGMVIASSNPALLPLGAKPEQAVQESRLVTLGNRRYFAKTATTKGYQGFYGLGWLGHVMRPLELAFQAETPPAGDAERDGARHGLENSALFSPELRAINRDIRETNLRLKHMVLNGEIFSINHNAAAMIPVLDGIRKVGEEIRRVIDKAIVGLHHTVISSRLNEARFQAFLAANIMDRNLYERSDDCRWWALTSDIRRILAAREIDDEGKIRLGDILRYINGLYTVYTNLLVYDGNGGIIASSTDNLCLGIRQHDETVTATLRNSDSQAYFVSPFQPTALYAKRPTYVYHASVTALDQPTRVVGGVAIVFDSEPQFSAMLNDCLPRNEKGEVLNGAFGVFADRHGNVISSTNVALPPGAKLAVEERLLQLPNGQGCSEMIVYEDKPYAVGCMVSSGYREYKSAADAYKNDVAAFMFIPV